MDDPRLLTYMGVDAEKWARIFCRKFGSDDIEPDNLIDESLMLGWFANAIEAGRSAGIKWERERCVETAETVEAPRPAPFQMQQAIADAIRARGKS